MCERLSTLSEEGYARSVMRGSTTLKTAVGLERKHHLIPVEAVSDQDPGSITLGVDQETVQSAPDFPHPHVAPDEDYQRTVREHYGFD